MIKVIGSTISGNSALGSNGNGQGGGIRAHGLLEVVRSTIVGNEASDGGGGIFMGGAIISQLSIITSTIAGNSAGDGGGMPGRAGEVSIHDAPEPFAQQSVTTLSGPAAAVVVNEGESPVPVAMQVARVIGPDRDDFLISSDTCTGEVLAPAAECEVRVRFA